MDEAWEQVLWGRERNLIFLIGSTSSGLRQQGWLAPERAGHTRMTLAELSIDQKPVRRDSVPPRLRPELLCRAAAHLTDVEHVHIDGLIAEVREVHLYRLSFSPNSLRHQHVSFQRKLHFWHLRCRPAVWVFAHPPPPPWEGSGCWKLRPGRMTNPTKHCYKPARNYILQFYKK